MAHKKPKRVFVSFRTVAEVEREAESVRLEQGAG
eukprot:COSAG06_NODE_10748_length_1624_cov_1.411803_3_plen_33_part_01